MNIQATASATGAAISQAASTTVSAVSNATTASVDAVKSIPTRGYQRLGTQVGGTTGLFPLVDWLCNWLIPPEHLPPITAEVCLSVLLASIVSAFIKGKPPLDDEN